MKTAKQTITIEITWKDSAFKRKDKTDNAPMLLANEFLPEELKLYPDIVNFQLDSKITRLKLLKSKK